MEMGLEPRTSEQVIIELIQMMQEEKKTPPTPTVASIQTEARKRTSYASYLKIFGYFPGATKWHLLFLLVSSGILTYGVYSSVNQGVNKLIENVMPADELAFNSELFNILNKGASSLVAAVVLLSSLNEMGKDLGQLEQFSSRRHFIGAELAKLRIGITELKQLVQSLAGNVPAQTTALIPTEKNSTSCNKLLQTFGFSPELTAGHYVLLFMLADIATNDTFNTIQKGVNSLLDYLVSAGQVVRNAELFNILANVIAAIAACVAMVLTFKSVAKGIVSLQQNTTQITFQGEELVRLQRDLEDIQQMWNAFRNQDVVISLPLSNAFFDREAQLIAERLEAVSVEFKEPSQESKSKNCTSLFSKCGLNSALSWKTFLPFTVGMVATTYETFDSAENAVLSGEEFIAGVIDYLRSSNELTRNYALLHTISTIMAGIVTAYIMMWTLKLVCKGLDNLKTDSAIIMLHGEALEALQADKADLNVKVHSYQAQQKREEKFYSPLFNLFGNMVSSVEEHLPSLPAALPTRGLTLTYSESETK